MKKQRKSQNQILNAKYPKHLKPKLCPSCGSVKGTNPLCTHCGSGKRKSSSMGYY